MNNKILQTLTIRPFLYLLLAEIFSQLGINMLNFMLVIVAYALTNSNTAVSGVLVSFTIPAILLGLLAGIIVDRLNKKKVLLLINVARAALSFLLIFLHVNLFFIYILSFSIAMFSQFFIPAETPMIPILVRRELLLSANALFGIIIYASIFVSYALSGPLLLIFGQTSVFVILSLFFLLAAIFVSLINIKKAKVNEERAVILQRITSDLSEEIKNALSLLAKTKIIIHALFMLTIANILIFVLVAIGPGYAQQILKIEIEKFPIFFVTPAMIGMAIGSIILGSFFHGYSKHNLTKIGLFLIGLSVLVLPYGSKVESRAIIQTINSYLPHAFTINILHIMIVIAFIMGFANALVFIPSNTILQEETSEQFRGKVYGALNTLVGISSLFPILIVGGLADLVGVKAVLTGIGIIILAIWGILSFR